MNTNKTIRQRINDFRALCASNRIKYKEVTDAAGLDYDSVRNNMLTDNISDERMTILEDTALDLRDAKKKVGVV